MGFGTSVAVGFRPLQATHDLVALARAAPRDVIGRVAAGVPPGDVPAGVAEALLRRLIDGDGCRFDPADTLALHESLALTAALPDDDFAAFVLATAVLLADRLQEGAGPDSLYWHRDAFAGQYRLADPPADAAIVTGFRALADTGRLVPDDRMDPPVPSVDPGRVRAAMTAVAPPLAGILSAGGAAAARDWESNGQSYLALPPARRAPVLAAFRLLYETDPAFRPFPGRRFDPGDHDAPLIPAGTAAFAR